MNTLSPTLPRTPDTGPQTIKYTGDPAGDQAAVLEAQQKDYETRFAPLERRLIGKVQDPGADVAAKAGTDVIKQRAITRETFMRDLQRSGTQVTARQNTAIDRGRGLDMARGKANAENLSRRQTMDNNMQATADLIGIGRDVQSGISQDLSSAASMQASRKAAGDQAKAASKAQTSSMVASVAGLALAAFL
jgi:hypothetical protein